MATLEPAPVKPGPAKQSVTASEPTAPPVVELLGQPLHLADDAPAALNMF
jgi:hypothetical protein